MFLPSIVSVVTLSFKIRHADVYLFCCLVRGLHSVTDCLPEPDQFSSCENLIRLPALKVFMWILGLSALLGNGYVVVMRMIPTSSKSKKRDMARVQDTMVGHLAIADSLMGLYMIIIASADVYYRNQYAYFAEEWQTSVLCKMAGFLSILSSESSVLFMTIISVDRYIGVVFSTSKVKLKPKTAKIAAYIAWSVTFAVSIIPVVARSYFGDAFYGRSTVCLALPLTTKRPPGWQYSVALFLGVNLVCFIIMIYCYFNIYTTAKSAASQVGRNSETRKKEIKLAIRMAFLVFSDMCCWMPIIIMVILALTGVLHIPSISYAWIAVFVLPLNSSLNPYLYTIISNEMSKRQPGRNKVTPAGNSTMNTELSLLGNPVIQDGKGRMCFVFV